MNNANNTTGEQGTNNAASENPFAAAEASQRKRKRVFWRIVFPLFIATLIAAPFIYRASCLWGIPDIGHPFDVEEFASYAPADEDNAFTYYRTTEGIFDESAGVVSEDLHLVHELETDLQSGQVALPYQDNWNKWLKNNQEALEIWKEGTECKEALAFDSKAILLPYQMLPAVGQTRAVTCLVLAKAKMLVEHGQFDEAWEWYKALFRFSRHQGHRSIEIDRFIGMATHSRCTSAIVNHWANRADISEQQLATAINDLTAAFMQTADSLDTLKANYWRWFNLLDTGNPAVQSLLEPSWQAAVELWLNNEPEHTLRLLKIQLAIELTKIGEVASEEKIQKYRSLQKSFPEKRLNELLDSSPFDLDIAKSRNRFQHALRRERGHQAVLIAVLAAQRFQRQHNRFPNSMKELQTAYPEISLVDPCATNKEGTADNALLNYRIDENKILVWSVGANGENNNGNLRYTIETGFDLGFEILLNAPAETSDENKSKSQTNSD